MLEYARDEFASGYTVMTDGAQLSPVEGAGAIGQMAMDPAQAAAGQFVLDLNAAIEGSTTLEQEQNIIGIFINGVKLTPDEIVVGSSTTVECDVQFSIDENDVVEIKYNRAG